MHTWRSFAVVACVVLGMSGAARAGWLEDADAARSRRDYPTALSIVKTRAEQGDAAAQFFLGWMYREGQCVPQDYKAALEWFTQVVWTNRIQILIVAS